MTVFLKNKHAHISFDILETFEAGIQLYGFEVKSIKNKHGSLKEAFIIIEDGELYLKKAHIPSYQPTNTPDWYESYRKRKLLLNKREIKNLMDKKQTKGLTIIPISMYSNNGDIKLEIALSKGKRKHDKREEIKRKDTERQLKRELKQDIKGL